MNTREELLNGLNDAVTIIRQLSNIQNRLNQVRGQYKNLKPNKKIGKLLKGLFVLCVLSCVFMLLQMKIWGLITGIIQVAVGCIAVKFIYKKINEKIDADNQQIVAENEQVKAKEQAVLNDLQKVQIAYRERVSYWYPDNYCTVDAVEFFQNAVKNYRADSLKEAINLYETVLHQKRVENTQKQALQEQRFANMANLVMQGAQLGEMSRHNATVEFEWQKANRTLNDIQTRL